MDLDTKRAILVLGLDSARINQCINTQEKPDDETLIAFVERTLDDGQFAQVKSHLADCPHCYAFYGEIRQLLRDPGLLATKEQDELSVGAKSSNSTKPGLLARLRENWLFGNYGLATGFATAAVVAIVITNFGVSPTPSFESNIASFDGSQLNWLASNDQFVKSFNPAFSMNDQPIHNVNVGIYQGLSLVNLTAPVQLPTNLLSCSSAIDTTDSTTTVDTTAAEITACRMSQNQAQDFGLWLTLTGFLCQDNDEVAIQQHLNELPDLRNSDLVFIMDELDTSSASNLCDSAEILFNTLIDR